MRQWRCKVLRVWFFSCLCRSLVAAVHQSWLHKHNSGRNAQQANNGASSSRDMTSVTHRKLSLASVVEAMHKGPATNPVISHRISVPLGKGPVSKQNLQHAENTGSKQRLSYVDEAHDDSARKPLATQIAPTPSEQGQKSNWTGQHAQSIGSRLSLSSVNESRHADLFRNPLVSQRASASSGQGPISNGRLQDAKGIGPNSFSLHQQQIPNVKPLHHRLPNESIQNSTGKSRKQLMRRELQANPRNPRAPDRTLTDDLHQSEQHSFFVVSSGDTITKLDGNLLLGTGVHLTTANVTVSQNVQLKGFSNHTDNASMHQTHVEGHGSNVKGKLQQSQARFATKETVEQTPADAAPADGADAPSPAAAEKEGHPVLLYVALGLSSLLLFVVLAMAFFIFSRMQRLEAADQAAQHAFNERRTRRLSRAASRDVGRSRTRSPSTSYSFRRGSSAGLLTPDVTPPVSDKSDNERGRKP